MTMLSTSSSSPASARGFTAIELMVTVAILAVLAALAAPSFMPIIERWRVRDAAENLSTALYFARSEAIRLGGSVIIARNTSDSGCTSSGNTDWSCGWRVFYDANNNGSQDTCNIANTPNECNIKINTPPPNTSITLTGSTGIIAIDRWGMLADSINATAPTTMNFLITPKGMGASSTNASRLCAGTGGRIILKKGSDSC